MSRYRVLLLVLCGAALTAGGVAAATALWPAPGTSSETVAEIAPAPTSAGALPSYVVRLPQATDFDGLKTEPVLSAINSPSTVHLSSNSTLVAEATPEDATASGGVAYLVRSDVYVRTGPSRSYSELGTATGGSELTVIAEQNGWLQVDFDGGAGWVSARYLEPASGGTPL